MTKEFPTKPLIPPSASGVPRQPNPNIARVLAAESAAKEEPVAGTLELSGKVDSWSFNPTSSDSASTNNGNPGVTQVRKNSDSANSTEPVNKKPVFAKVFQALAEVGDQAKLTEAEKNPGYYSTGLPSRFMFYRFKTLSVSLIRGRHQAKLNRAAAEGKGRYVVETVTSLLGDGVSAMDLTTGDFYWLLYWILFASYPSRQRDVTVTCSNEAHLDAVLEGARPESSLRYLVSYDKPHITETDLDVPALEALDLSSLDGIDLGAFYVRDMVDWEENYEAKATAEDYYIYDLAVYLLDGTLEERADKVRDMSVVQMAALKAYRAEMVKHGVIAKLKSTCHGCGAENEDLLSISAHDFL